MPFDCSPRHASLKLSLADIGRNLSMLGVGVHRYKPPHSIQALWNWSTHFCWMTNSNYCFHFEWIKLLEQWLTMYCSGHKCYAKHGFANCPSCICIGLFLLLLLATILGLKWFIWIWLVFLAVFKRTISWHNIGAHFDPPLATSNFRLLVKFQILLVVPDMMVKYCRN